MFRTEPQGRGSVPSECDVVEQRRRSDGWDYANAALLALTCAIFMALRWKKMGSLLWLDPAHWLNEISRVARGEMPYRDFSFQYPPFAVFLYGWLLRVFGIRFTTVQVITDAIDIAVVLACYALLRGLLPRSLKIITVCCLVVVCATSLMNFNLFSYVTYSPSLQTGALGVLLLLLALIRYIQHRSLGVMGWALASCGGFIAVLSKPESALAALCMTAVFALVVRDWRAVLPVGAAVFAPATAAWAVVVSAAGLANVRAGISGYGLATAFCPWWPTGVGVFGILAAIGAAAAIALASTLPKRSQFAARYGRRYRELAWAGTIGAVVYFAYIGYQSREALTEPGLSFLERIRRTLPLMVYTSPMLEPVLWVCILAFVVLAWRVLVRRGSGRQEAVLLLILTAPAAMSARGLFGTTQSNYPEVAAICYPFLLVLAPWFLWRFLEPAAGARYAAVLVAVLLIGYAMARTVGAWPELLSDRSYGTLQTEAGTVKLLNYDVDAKVYAFVMAHTTPADYVLDMPYGGGLNFASGRRSPIFDTMLWGMGIPARYEDLDVDLMKRRPPRLVIGQDEPHLGTYWGYGQRGNRACPCPRLVWMPDGLSWDPNRVLRVARYVEDHYRVSARIGNKLILAPR